MLPKLLSVVMALTGTGYSWERRTPTAWAFSELIIITVRRMEIERMA